MKCDPQNWAELYPDVHALDVQWPWASLATSDAEPSKQDGTNFRLPSSSGWITLDPAVGARIAWIRDGRGAWKELRAGTWMRSHGNNLRVVGSIFAPEYHARVLHCERPFTIIDCGRAEYPGAQQIVQVDLQDQIEAGISRGKPSAAGASVTVSSTLLRWSVLDGRSGVCRAFVRVGGVNGEYVAVEHGQPFPIEGASFEARVHPAEYGSLATFIHSAQPLNLPPTLGVSVYEVSLAASTAGLDNMLVIPASGPTVNAMLLWDTTGAGTYVTEYLQDPGDGAAPAVAAVGGGATTGARQTLGQGLAGIPNLSVRFVTFGGAIRVHLVRPQ